MEFGSSVSLTFLTVHKCLSASVCTYGMQVALLEVSREEEFAPIKNAVGPGVADTAATARELIVSLHQRVDSLSETEMEKQGFLLLKAYAGGQLGGNKPVVGGHFNLVQGAEL